MWTRTILFLALFLVAQLNVAQGYASWMQCYVDLDESEVMMNQQVLPETKAPHAVTVEILPEHSETWLSTNYTTYPKDALTSIQVRLKVPPELEKRDVQFVVETTEGAKFVEPVMCEGRRSFARAYDDAVTLVLEGSTDTVSLKAGWAMGYEAVTLTPSLVLKLEQSEPDMPSAKDDAEGSDDKEEL